jgi:hypothetical protein
MMELAKRLLAFLRTVPKVQWAIGAAASAVVLAVFTGWLLQHRDMPPPPVHKRAAHAARVARADEGRPLAPPVKNGAPSVPELVAQTRAKSCAERSEAAQKLAGTHDPKAIAALRKLANSSFDDESRSPGIFSCSSRRAAQKALQQTRS